VLERPPGPIRRWLAGRARRRIAREMADYRNAQVRLAPLFGRVPRQGQHLHRSLVQVNFFQRPR
jgi:hypothetical protein